MPDASGRFHGITVPDVPWHRLSPPTGTTEAVHRILQPLSRCPHCEARHPFVDYCTERPELLALAETTICDPPQQLSLLDDLEES